MKMIHSASQSMSVASCSQKKGIRESEGRVLGFMNYDGRGFGGGVGGGEAGGGDGLAFANR